MKQQPATYWDDFSQLMIKSDDQTFFQKLRAFLETAGLRLNDVSYDPMEWESCLFLYHERMGDGSSQITLSEPDSEPSMRQINDEFACHFMEYAGLDGAFVCNDTYLDIVQLILFKGGKTVLYWFDTVSSPRYLGESIAGIEVSDDVDDLEDPEGEGYDGTVVAVRELPSYVEYYDEELQEFKEDSGYEYMLAYLEKEGDPLDELLRYEFIEENLSRRGYEFTPSLDHLEFVSVWQLLEW